MGGDAGHDDRTMDLPDAMDLVKPFVQVKRERDEARLQCEVYESDLRIVSRRLLDALEKLATEEAAIYRWIWPYTTPEGHTYNEPADSHGVIKRLEDHAQGLAEGWDASELPPEPTWRMVSLVVEAFAAAKADRERLFAEANSLKEQRRNLHLDCVELTENLNEALSEGDRVIGLLWEAIEYGPSWTVTTWDEWTARARANPPRGL